ncbi:MAG: 16S rRNA (cytosine(1402)-N(4))-methyltransferase RsmH [Pseudomonadota bacterium]
MAAAEARHAPVLLEEVLAGLRLTPESRVIDGTFGAGGYSRAFLAAGAAVVLGLDRDRQALDAAASWAASHGDRLRLREARFSGLDAVAEAEALAQVDAVALDVGVSSMQLDQAARGFSFLRDGPLDMRMGAEGPSAADLVNRAAEAALADAFFHLGEERAARRIARAIFAARAEAPIETTGRLAEIIAAASPKPRRAGAKRGRPGGAEIHPATRCFQALRIAVNNELGELSAGLAAAERALAPGGRLAVVSFHSLEDRLVKRFLAERGGRAPRGSRHEPEINQRPASFRIETSGAIAPGAAELARNPRARSAKLRVAVRAEADAWPEPPSPQRGLDADSLLARRK